MIRRLEPGEEARLDAFLQQHWASSMFLRSNVHAHGLSGTGHRIATTVWAAEDSGRITGVMGCTQSGILLVQAPDVPEAFWPACRAALAGRLVQGGTGVPEQMEALCRALGLRDFGKVSDEPLMAVDFTDLKRRAVPGHIRAGEPGDLPWLGRWFIDMAEETGLAAAALNDAGVMAQRFVGEGIGRLLILEDGTPVAMTSYNARLPDCVQLGGVYTPPEHRRRGYSAGVISLHLDALAREGVTRAILFAASDTARQLYQSLGFDVVGTYGLRLLARPQEVAA